MDFSIPNKLTEHLQQPPHQVPSPQTAMGAAATNVVAAPNKMPGLRRETREKGSQRLQLQAVRREE